MLAETSSARLSILFPAAIPPRTPRVQNATGLTATLTSSSTISGLSDGNSSTNIFDEPEDSHPERRRDIEHSEANGFIKIRGWMADCDVFDTVLYILGFSGYV
jgi:hypothetical protein